MTEKNPHAIALGRLGGAARSPRKARAARANGQLGGRPSRLAMEAEEAHACPVCDAAPGSRCEFSDGRSRRGLVHAPRLRVARDARGE